MTPPVVGAVAPSVVGAVAPSVVGAVAAVLAAAGGYLIWSGAVPNRPARRLDGPTRLQGWLTEAGLRDVPVRAFGAALAVAGLAGGLVGYLLFDSAAPAAGAALFGASFPVAAYRRRRSDRLGRAAEAWPRLLAEMRLRTAALGRSIPQAFFEAGRRAPAEWRGAFAAAEREWLLTTDFARSTSRLKAELADPTADVVCETLLLAHEVGGTDIGACLTDLIEDRELDLQARKDAASRQAGVRFARRFVLIVPLGMALAGLAIGTGRRAYATPGGQIAVLVGLAATAGCWIWAGRLMKLPEPPRVFR